MPGSTLPGGIIWFKKPMAGHDRFPTYLEFAFEERVQTSFKKALHFDKIVEDEHYAIIEDVASELHCKLRFGVLDSLTESSFVVRAAEEKALAVFRARVYQEEKFLERPEDPMTPEDEFNLRREWVQEYKEPMELRFCYNLKFCYPMFANQHTHPVWLSNRKGRFYCPCGRACFAWRLENVVSANDSNTTRYWGGEKKYCLDYCGGLTHDAYTTLDELMIHLESEWLGPMHHAAAAYMRSIYYNLKIAVPAGVEVIDVDLEQVVIKEEMKDSGNDM